MAADASLNPPVLVADGQVPGRFPLSHRRALPGSPAASGDGGAGGAAVKSCWLCGIRMTADSMVADGGPECADVRWYCADAQACTERWTTPRPASPADARGGAAAPPATKKRPPGGSGIDQLPSVPRWLADGRPGSDLAARMGPWTHASMCAIAA
jgi:hypothetical protein